VAQIIGAFFREIYRADELGSGMRKLDRRARRVFALFSKQDRITTLKKNGKFFLTGRTKKGKFKSLIHG
jgi:hypothetical protein